MTERYVMIDNPIQLVDRGRGLQLSTSRITVQDLVPYFQEGCSHEEIIRWIPTLTSAEIAVVEQYYREHKEQLDEEDRRIRQHTEEQQRLQHLRFPELDGDREARVARFRQLLHQRRQEKNGEGFLADVHARGYVEHAVADERLGHLRREGA